MRLFIFSLLSIVLIACSATDKNAEFDIHNFYRNIMQKPIIVDVGDTVNIFRFSKAIAVWSEPKLTNPNFNYLGNYHVYNENDCMGCTVIGVDRFIALNRKSGCDTLFYNYYSYPDTNTVIHQDTFLITIK